MRALTETELYLVACGNPPNGYFVLAIYDDGTVTERGLPTKELAKAEKQADKDAGAQVKVIHV